MKVSKKYFCDYCEYCEDISKNTLLFTCQTCQLVKYCSVDCQIKAKPEHEEFCLQRAKDLQSLEAFISQYPSLNEGKQTIGARRNIKETLRSSLSIALQHLLPSGTEMRETN